MPTAASCFKKDSIWFVILISIFPAVSVLQTCKCVAWSRQCCKTWSIWCLWRL